ncbi:hypothetical protein BH23PLA1_BH23PLA1_06370 [soil metagenome]
MNAVHDPPTQDQYCRSLAGSSELRAVLLHLGQEIARPLLALRTDTERVLTSAWQPGSTDQSSHLLMLLTLCDDLLQMTRDYLEDGLLRGARPLSLGNFTLQALIREIDLQFRPEAHRRQLTWKCVLEGPDAVVKTDACRFQRIVGQLVTNALRFTADGGEVVVVARREESQWGIDVSDQGPGIPEDSLEKVFEPFFRLPRDDRAGLAGQGIGLAICRELVQQMQGQIRLHSRQGQGTRVEVRFPTAIGPLARSDSTPTPPPTG